MSRTVNPRLLLSEPSLSDRHVPTVLVVASLLWVPWVFPGVAILEMNQRVAVAYDGVFVLGCIAGTASALAAYHLLIRFLGGPKKSVPRLLVAWVFGFVGLAFGLLSGLG